MPTVGTDLLSTSLYQRHSTNSSSGTTGIEYMLVQTVMNIRHRDEGSVAAEGGPPLKLFKNVAGKAITPLRRIPQIRPPSRRYSHCPLQIFSIPEIRQRNAPQAVGTAQVAYIRGHRLSAGIIAPATYRDFGEARITRWEQCSMLSEQAF